MEALVTFWSHALAAALYSALVLWELRFEAAGRLFERAEHIATDRDAYRKVAVSGAHHPVPDHDLQLAGGKALHPVLAPQEDALIRTGLP